MDTIPVDRYRRSVRRLGYRIQDSASRPSVGAEFWQAEATRGGRVIRAWAPTRAAAWELVCQMAGAVEQEQDGEAAAAGCDGPRRTVEAGSAAED